MDGLDDLMSAFAGVNMDDHEELVESFARILGADSDQSRFFLEASSWNLETAICTFLDTVGSRVRAPRRLPMQSSAPVCGARRVNAFKARMRRCAAGQLAA